MYCTVLIGIAALYCIKLFIPVGQPVDGKSSENISITTRITFAVTRPCQWLTWRGGSKWPTPCEESRTTGTDTWLYPMNHGVINFVLIYFKCLPGSGSHLADMSFLGVKLSCGNRTRLDLLTTGSVSGHRARKRYVIDLMI